MVATIEKLHLKRLEKKGITIEEIYENDVNEDKLVRSSDGLRNDNIVNSKKSGKEIFL